MNKLNFNQSVGFPLETEILDEMQKAWSVLNALGAIAGNLTIISGCDVTGATAANGVVFIDGEVLAFHGGVVQANVIIVEVPHLRQFEDLSSHDVIYERYATFGTATVEWSWADFKRGMETKAIADALALKEEKTVVTTLAARITALEAITTVNVPSGLIAIWGQAASLIPAGWTEYTPLRGRMPVGYDSAIPGFDTLGLAGGSKTHTNTLSEMVPHTHAIRTTTHNAAGGGSEHIVGGGLNGQVTESAGTGNAYDIMNPYRIVLYIQKT